MERDSFEKKTISGFGYKFAESIGVKGVSFVISIILARLILPEQFGIISLVTILVEICDVCVTYGFGNSLVIDKKSDDVDFSTCFYFGIGLSVIVYGIVYMGAPYLAEYYGYDILCDVVRVMSLRIPIAAINSVQQAYVAKNMLFSKSLVATMLGNLLSGIVSIIMAYNNYGVWALVVQNLGNVCITTVCTWLIIKWRPRLVFSLKRLKIIYAYGWKILFTGLIDTGYNQLRTLVIAKRYTSSDLAYYSKGMSFPTFGMGIIDSTITGVLFPALSKCNDNVMKMKDLTRKVVSISTYIVFPIMVGLFAVAQPLVILLISEKWLSAVIYLQIGCVAYLFRPVQVINNCVIQACKRSDLLLKLDIVKKLVGIIGLLLSMQYGVMAIAISLCVTNIFSTIISVFPNVKLIKYRYLEQLKDIGLNLLVALLMGCVVMFETQLNISMILLIVLQIVTGVIAYILFSFIFKLEAFKDIYMMLITVIRKRKGCK